MNYFYFPKSCSRCEWEFYTLSLRNVILEDYGHLYRNLYWKIQYWGGGGGGGKGSDIILAVVIINISGH